MESIPAMVTTAGLCATIKERDCCRRSSRRKEKEEGPPGNRRAFFFVIDVVGYFFFFELAFFAGFEADFFFALPFTTSDCPEKISGFFRPLRRINDSVDVPYFFAIPPSVSPRFTTCVVDEEPALDPYRSMSGSGSDTELAPTVAVGTRIVVPAGRLPLFNSLTFGL